MINKGLEIVKIIRDNGYDAVVVGGAVRDFIMGNTPHDIDIAANAPMTLIENLFKSYDIGKQKMFNIVTVNHKGEMFEVANYRTDGEYVDGRRPETTEIVNTFEEDAKRRDLSINALGIDHEGNIVDHVGGLQDIHNRIIRTVGNPYERFQEDYLRILRAIRFAGRLGFDIEHETQKAITDLRHHVVLIAPERIKDELFKMASGTGNQLADTIEIMDYLGVLEIILPELKRLQNTQEEMKYHPESYVYGNGTPYDHTLQALRKNTIKDPIHNICVLCHDLGKGVTHRVDKTGRNRYHGHDFEGAKIFNEIADRLKFSNEEREVVLFSINHHMKLTHVKEMRKSKVARLTASPHFDTLRNTVYCDDACRLDAYDPARLEKALEYADNVKLTVEVKDNRIVIVTGHQVMEILNITPGKVVGYVINEVTDRFLDSEDVVCIKRLVREAHENYLLTLV